MNCIHNLPNGILSCLWQAAPPVLAAVPLKLPNLVCSISSQACTPYRSNWPRSHLAISRVPYSLHPLRSVQLSFCSPPCHTGPPIGFIANPCWHLSVTQLCAFLSHNFCALVPLATGPPLWLHRQAGHSGRWQHQHLLLEVQDPRKGGHAVGGRPLSTHPGLWHRCEGAAAWCLRCSCRA